MNEQELAELDLSVAKAEGIEVRDGEGPDAIVRAPGYWRLSGLGYEPYQPTRDPAEAMRLLEKYTEIGLRAHGEGWLAYRARGVTASMILRDSSTMLGHGPTPCIAICRAVVALKSAP